MNNDKQITVRALATEPTETDEARKLFTEEMERLGAPSAVAAAQQSAPQPDGGDVPAAPRRFFRRRG